MRSLCWILWVLFVVPGSGLARTDARVEHFLELVQRRLDLSVEVARIKWNTGRAIDDPQRESELVERMVALRGSGVAEERVRSFFAAQIEASKQVQRALHEQWTAARQPPFRDARDLELLRPELDRVSVELLRSLEQLPSGECVAAAALQLWGEEWSLAQQTALAPVLSRCTR